MSEWTLTYNGTTKSLAEWGFAKPKLSYFNQMPDSLELTQEGKNFDSAPTFSYSESIEIAYGGKRYFVGVITSNPRFGEAASEGISYTAHGLWWYLEQLVFQQSWKIATDNAGTAELSSIYKASLILGKSESGNSLHLGEQLNEILTFATTHGAPFSIGTIDPIHPFPPIEAEGITCAEAIRLLLRWAPDCVCWFDYSTVPNPTLHIRKRTNLTTHNLSLGTDPLHAISLTAREDLRPAAVAIQYEQTHEIDQQAWTEVHSDVYPVASDPFAFSTILFVIPLDGRRGNLQRQTIIADDLTPSTKAWWLKKMPWLRKADFVRTGNPTYSGISISNVTIKNSDTGLTVSLPREILSGQTPSWLSDHSEDVEVTAKISYMLPDATLGFVEYEDEEFTIQVVATDLESRTYTHLNTSSGAEAVPVGLAQQYYESVSQLHYEGMLTLEAREATPLYHPGSTVNIHNSATEFATMQALVQEAHHDLQSGITKLKLGAPEHLAPQDLVDMLRSQRERKAATRQYERTNAQPTGNNPPVDGGTLSAHVRTHANAQSRSLATKVQLDSESYGMSVQLTQGELTGLPQNLTGKWRKFTICDNGVEKTVMLLASEPYDEPT